MLKSVRVKLSGKVNQRCASQLGMRCGGGDNGSGDYELYVDPVASEEQGGVGDVP